MNMKVTSEMISAALNAPTLGDEGSYVFDYITSPEPNDPDWKAIGGKPSGHPSWGESEWQWHIVRRILEAAMERA